MRWNGLPYQSFGYGSFFNVMTINLVALFGPSQCLLYIRLYMGAILSLHNRGSDDPPPTPQRILLIFHLGSEDLIADRSRWRQDSNWERMSETCWKQQNTKEEKVFNLRNPIGWLIHGIVYLAGLFLLIPLIHLKLYWINFGTVKIVYNFRAQLQGTGSRSEVLCEKF